jgi:hypothetical protein
MILDAKVIYTKVIELINIYTLYYDHFCIYQIYNDSNFNFKNLQRKINV